MQEVSLFAGISAYKKEKVMHVLTRLTGQKQSTFMEWYMVYVPPSGKQFVSAFSRKPSTESVRWDAQSESIYSMHILCIHYIVYILCAYSIYTSV